jgi:hypothetical protein
MMGGGLECDRKEGREVNKKQRFKGAGAALKEEGGRRIGEGETQTQTQIRRYIAEGRGPTMDFIRRVMLYESFRCRFNLPL